MVVSGFKKTERCTPLAKHFIYHQHKWNLCKKGLFYIHNRDTTFAHFDEVIAYAAGAALLDPEE